MKKEILASVKYSSSYGAIIAAFSLICSLMVCSIIWGLGFLYQRIYPDTSFEEFKNFPLILLGMAGIFVVLLFIISVIFGFTKQGIKWYYSEKKVFEDAQKRVLLKRKKKQRQYSW